MKTLNIFICVSILTMMFCFLTEGYALSGDLPSTPGKQATCLDDGENICPSTSKCVNSEAVCFDSNSCGSGGFICKSEWDAIAKDYDELVKDYNKLVKNYDDVASAYDELRNTYNSLVSEYENAPAKQTVVRTVASPTIIRNPGPCIGNCGSEQGMCISQCGGNGQCIGNCAAAHGRCVAYCTR